MVYLVCDDPSLRVSLVWLLASAGYLVEVCSHADAAREGDESFANACLLLDMRSSPASGVALLDRLGRRPTFPPVILMTGYDQPLAVIRSFPDQSTAASRPFDIGLLERVEAAIATGRRALERSRELAELARRLEQLTPQERRALAAILAESPDEGATAGSQGAAGVAATQRARLLRKLRVRSWSRLAHLTLQLEEGSYA